MTDNRRRLVGGMYEYVTDIVTCAMQKNRKLIVWGCGKGGAFVTHLLRDMDGRLPVAYYIDEYIVVPCVSAGNIYRSSLLWYLDPQEYVVLLSIRHNEAVIRFLERLGYVKNRTYFDVREDIGGSYLEYLEKTNISLDFSYVTKEDRPDLYSGEYFESKPFDHSSVDHVFEEISVLPCERSFLDIGCGKGQMLLMAFMNDMDKICGIEWNNEIADIAKQNVDILGIDADVMAVDATEYEELDEYSIFFLYNPFGENSIKKLAKNLINSYRRKQRDMYLVYGNPFFHKAIMSTCEIKLHRQIESDLYDPLLNIYRVGG